MGIAVKRSDFASETKEFLKELLNIVLKGTDYSPITLMKFVDRKRRHFIDLIQKGSKTIAKPVAYTKPVSEYKVVPQGVRAMVAFNEISYDIHTVGTRSYMFHVVGVDETKAPKDVIKNYNKFLLKGKKLEVVAIPDEERFLPNYYVLNNKSMINACFEDRYRVILKPLFEVKKTEGILTI